MKRLIKRWSRKRRAKKRQRNDFSDDIRRAERKKKLKRSSAGQLIRKIGSAVFVFREPQWAKSRPMTKRGTKRAALARGSYFNPLMWIWGFLRFLASWLKSRPYASLLPALPAVVVMLGILGLVVWYRSSGGTWRDSLYRQHVNAALQRKDFARAMVSVNTLIDHNHDDTDLKFRRALIAGELDQPQHRDYYMQRLAADNHVPAIMWILSNHFHDGQVNQWDADKQRRYAVYLTSLLKHARGNDLIVAKKLMGVYLSQMGATAEAEKYLAELANDQPDLLLTLALLNRQIGKANRAKQYAADARRYLQSLLTQNPHDVASRIQLAQAMAIAGDWDDSVRVLQEGYLINADARLTAALGEALANASLQLDNKTRLDPQVLTQRLAYAASALKVAPDNAIVLDAVVTILSETRNVQHDDEQAGDLRRAILSGLRPEILHFVEGTLALLDGRNEEGVKHLQLANAQGLNSPGILNNLAVAMSAKEGADLEEALKLAEAALELLPDHPFVLETRGQILLKLRRYQEAIVDLEKSLVSVSDPSLRQQIYSGLAEAYGALELGDMARNYRRLSDQTQQVIADQANARGNVDAANQ
jgi:hypothetical protein